jgi:peptidyl-prolyl cis-trans isomerase SurA
MPNHHAAASGTTLRPAARRFSKRCALFAGAAAMAALPFALPSTAQAQFAGGGQSFGQSAAPGAPGAPDYYGRPTTHGPAPEEKPKHEEAPPGEEPAIRIPAPKLQAAPADADAIAAVVNGDVITREEVVNRAKLFGLSTGLAITPDLLARLKPQLVRELIDERLKVQEIQHRKIVVNDADVATAISTVEQRNGLPHGGLREKLAKAGVSFSTLIEQTRTSLGWTRVLRQELASRGYVTPAEVEEQEALFKKQTGQPQYHVAEIFVPAEDPSRQNDARKFADTVIQQLRAGAPFGIVAAEFSQSDTALKGGDLGWVRPDQLDPPIAALVQQMPTGAISNPIHVAGGYEVVALQEKRLIGSDLATVLSLRQAFFPFTSALDPQNPTAQQKAALVAAQGVSKSASSCNDIEAANASQGGKRPTNPGDLRLDRMNPQMQTLLKSLSPGHASKALVTPEGVMVLMVCSSTQKNMAAMTKDDIADQLIQERVELASRQLQQDLKRRALIDQRQS